MRGKLLATSGVAGVVAAAAIFAATAPAAAATAKPGHGSAYGAEAEVKLLPGVLGGVHVGTGKMAASSTDGKTKNEVVGAELKPIINASVVSSSSKHDAKSGKVTSSAKVVDATLPLLKGVVGKTPEASVITSKCVATSKGITGSSDLANLDLGKLGNIHAGTPNLKIEIPEVAKIVANEQVKNSDGSLTVNALHVQLLGGKVTKALGSGDIVLASSTCGKATDSKPNPPTDKPKPPTTTPPHHGGGDHNGGGNNGGGDHNGGGSNGGSTGGATTPGTPQVSVVPKGAPETGDGSLAAVAG
ncbi:choice-of-anchor P family protein [Sciscionella sediminilitoris]|uniref:choice-of-anchor P family protein n=1 Tax=Sciscionella sediminilitoris TaxID=1445613 RepID=UPI0004DF18DB|nr:choice-of-anchor P family protein [Sciscionella sp. SE31]